MCDAEDTPTGDEQTKCGRCRWGVSHLYSVRNDDIGVCNGCLVDLMQEHGDVVLPGEDMRALAKYATTLSTDSEKAALLDTLLADIEAGGADERNGSRDGS